MRAGRARARSMASPSASRRPRSRSPSSREILWSPRAGYFIRMPSSVARNFRDGSGVNAPVFRPSVIFKVTLSTVVSGRRRCRAAPAPPLARRNAKPIPPVPTDGGLRIRPWKQRDWRGGDGTRAGAGRPGTTRNLGGAPTNRREAPQPSTLACFFGTFASPPTMPPAEPMQPKRTLMCGMLRGGPAHSLMPQSRREFVLTMESGTRKA